MHRLPKEPEARDGAAVARSPHRTHVAGRREVAGERGIALIITLLVVTLLVIVVFQLSYTTKVEIRLAKNRLDTTVLRYAQDGAITRAMAYIQTDAAENQWDARGDLWESASFAADEGGDDYDYQNDPWGEEDAKEEGEIELDVAIVDEDRKLNIALLAERPEPKDAANETRGGGRKRGGDQGRGGDPERGGDAAMGREPRNEAAEKKKREQIFESLISILVEFRDETSYDLSGTDARTLAEAIRDYVTRPVERSDAAGKVPHPSTVDPPMLTIDELLSIEGVTEDLLFDFMDPDDEEVLVPGLLNFITVWSSGFININTAPEVVLRSLFEGDKKKLVGDIMDFREKYDEEKKDEEKDFGKKAESGSEEAESPGIFKETSELQSENILDNEDYQKIAPFIQTKSSVFSVFVTAKRGKVENRMRAVVRRLNGQVYPLFYEARKDKLLYGREQTDEEEEGGGGGFF